MLWLHDPAGDNSDRSHVCHQREKADFTGTLHAAIAAIEIDFRSCLVTDLLFLQRARLCAPAEQLMDAPIDRSHDLASAQAQQHVHGQQRPLFLQTPRSLLGRSPTPLRANRNRKLRKLSKAQPSASEVRHASPLSHQTLTCNLLVIYAALTPNSRQEFLDLMSVEADRLLATQLRVPSHSPSLTDPATSRTTSGGTPTEPKV